MNIYLAGGFNGNMSPFWREYIGGMAQGLSEQECYERGRHKFLNGEETKVAQFKVSDLSILETFFYARKNEQIQKLLPYPKNFLLDSGAFTFMSNSKVTANWDEYVEEYAQFINRYNVELFFELDIDSIVGIREVERLRYKLEKMTNKQSIPVFHISRGKEYFVRMCEQYPYVAFGGIVTDDVKTAILEKYFPWFINTAHKHGAKIHGLGYTSIAGLYKYHFDSVDSTAWLYGNRGGFAYQFNVRTGHLEQTKAPEGKKMRSRSVAFNNYSEWVRFSKYARENL